MSSNAPTGTRCVDQSAARGGTTDWQKRLFDVPALAGHCTGPPLWADQRRVAHDNSHLLRGEKTARQRGADVVCLKLRRHPCSGPDLDSKRRSERRPRQEGDHAKLLSGEEVWGQGFSSRGRGIPSTKVPRVRRMTEKRADNGWVLAEA